MKKQRVPRVRWEVYGRDHGGEDHFLGATLAISEPAACNQVRHRVYGETPYDRIPLIFHAFRHPSPLPQPRPTTRQLPLL